MTALDWFGDQLEKDIETAAAAMLLMAAQTLQRLHKKELSRSNPPPLHNNPSKPGEYARGRTWNLRDSVAYEPVLLSEVRRLQRVRLGYRMNADYGVRLGEQMGRKWLEDSLRENDAAIAAALQGIGQAGMN